MAYQVAWSDLERVLELNLEGNVTLDDFRAIEKHISARLEERDGPVTLLVAASSVRISPDAVGTIRASQSYLQGQHIRHIVVVAKDKLARLSLLLVFNLCRPTLRFFDTDDLAAHFLKARLLT
ncbi:MAG: STAS/SEC14 domain-containing protein [Anaerolineae bacterium]|nr:STAS/SEC14 domain-containing protein [Anaerolineae bacterium]